MVIPKYQDGKTDDSTIALRRVQLMEENTRKAGGQEPEQCESITPKVIVDIREFRSDLPCLIHRRGIEITPVTITVNIFLKCLAVTNALNFVCIHIFRSAIIF